MAKGGSFERRLCRDLSLWLSRGKDDDLLWRSSQSGGRATVRRRKGKGTKGHCGDIAPTCPAGGVLTKLVTIEAKVGYFEDTVFGLFDNKGKCGKTWPKWIAQATFAALNAGTPYWWIVHQRNKRGKSRTPLIMVPSKFLVALERIGVMFKTALILENAAVFRLDEFFQCVDPQDIRTLSRKVK